MITFKCKMCGGDLHPEENATTCECEYCGSVQTIPMADNEKNGNLFNRANRLRMAAEYDNYHRRSREEKDATYDMAVSDTVSELLPIIDNLERAVGVSGAEAVQKGLEMTLHGASDALSKMGVEAFGAEGDQFDPNMHSAMMMVDDENHKEGEIVTVFQKGYRKGDKIIRYAMVTVAN
jgi:molecular chaperone GrpE